ncbi:MAG: hypothetical protein RJA44_2768 [Pseudomonadota bacterium]|jgi:hypothetical protein
MTGRSSRLGLALLLGLSAAAPAGAQEFHLYLQCQGTVSTAGKSTPAQLLLALRDNNNTALIQKSNVLPVGERLRYVDTPAAYTLVWKLPLREQRPRLEWLPGPLLVAHPNLRKLDAIRLSIDRQDGSLDGQMLNSADESLGTLAMDCEPQAPGSQPAPKF